VGHFERKFKYMWMSPAIHLWTVGLRSDVATTLPLDVFTRRNIVADLFDRSWILLKKTAKSRFVPFFGGRKGNVHSSSKVRWKARGRLPISAN